MRQLIEPVVMLDDGIPCQIRDHAESVIDRAETLRLGEAALPRKKMALTDTLRVLRAFGFRYHAVSIRLASPDLGMLPGRGLPRSRLRYTDTSSLARILASAPLCNDNEAAFFDVVELMRALRVSVGSHHADLTSMEAKRCLGILVTQTPGC
jgi:hypothetical protein